jgi:hypothetical protein
MDYKYFPAEKNVVAGALFCLEIDNFNIQEKGQEPLTLLSESENSNIFNIKSKSRCILP